MKIRFSIATIFVVIFASCAALGQPMPPPPGGGPGDSSMSQEYRNKLEHRIFNMVAWELADEMDLPAGKEQVFLDALRDYFGKKKDLVHEQFTTMRELEQLIKGKNKDESIQKKLVSLENNRKKQDKLEADFRNSLKKILTVKQRAQFEVSWPQVMDRVRQFVREHKEGRKKMMGEKYQEEKNGAGAKGALPVNKQPSKKQSNPNK
jgi:Spy/CpxP family protein refolding chaperone